MAAANEVIVVVVDVVIGFVIVVAVVEDFRLFEDELVELGEHWTERGGDRGG